MKKPVTECDLFLTYRRLNAPGRKLHGFTRSEGTGGGRWGGGCWFESGTFLRGKSQEQAVSPGCFLGWEYQRDCHGIPSTHYDTCPPHPCTRVLEKIGI